MYLEGKKEAPHRMLAKIASKNSGLKFKLKLKSPLGEEVFPYFLLITAFRLIVTPNFELERLSTMIPAARQAPETIEIKVSKNCVIFSHSIFEGVTSDSST